jgi:hypothetical protein
MEIAIQLVIGLVTGIITVAIAASKGRSLVGWFFVGFLTGLIGIIVCACMSNLNTERERQRLAALEQHRLREQLRQERLKGEAFRRYAADRLDAHDNMLGVDTRAASALPGATQGALPAENQDASAEAALARMSQGGAPSAMAAPPSWYYSEQGQALGPVHAGDILAMARTGQINSQTLLWTQGMSGWMPATQVPQFRGQL